MLVKMKYGIDLGTTNSAICKMENGEPLIRKTDTLKDTLPSCVSFTRRQVIKVGDAAMNDLRLDKARSTKSMHSDQSNVFVEFKRTMGLDTQYASSHMGRSFSSEELSAEVLKTLKSFVQEEKIDACVITIPAKFTPDQISATKRAAELAGIEHCELLQEPIAASIAYGLSVKEKEGRWMVFDFGGGTFDAALIHVQDGIMQVIDTEGDNYLGGKNLDYAIVDTVIIPYLEKSYSISGILRDDRKRQILRDAMKYYAEQAKNQLSFKSQVDIMSQLDEFGEDDEGNPIELDLVITQAQVEAAVRPFFQKAVDITKRLLERNNLTDKLDKLILVGGPTYSPVLRRLLREQVTPNVDTSIDPMTAVAKGAALYAAGIDSDASQTLDSGTVALDVQYNANSVEDMEFVTVRLLKKESTGAVPDSVYVEFVRSDKAWSSGKVLVDEIGDVFECSLLEGRPNAFHLVAYDLKGNVIPCFPEEINIIQGAVAGNAILPRNIGIEVRDVQLGRDVFVPIKGLEKNKQLPAVGVRNGLKVSKQLRPGMEEDRLIIPIYIGEDAAEGTSAIYNDHVFDVVITGDDVPSLVPENSFVDITIKIDKSQQMTLEASFPVIGEVVERQIEVKPRSMAETERELTVRHEEAQSKIRALRDTPAVGAHELVRAEGMLRDIESRFQGEIHSDDGQMHLLASLRELFREMESVEKSHEWDTLASELKKEVERLEKADRDLGRRYEPQVSELRARADEALSSRNVQRARSVLADVDSLYFTVTYIYQLMGFFRHHSTNFNNYKWKDAVKARTLLNEGLSLISAGNPDEEELRTIAVDVIDLMDIPVSEKPKL